MTGKSNFSGNEFILREEDIKDWLDGKTVILGVD